MDKEFSAIEDFIPESEWDFKISVTTDISKSIKTTVDDAIKDLKQTIEEEVKKIGKGKM